MLVLNPGEGYCPHCGTIVFKWYVQINHECPLCRGKLEVKQLLVELLYPGEGCCNHCGQIIYLWFVRANSCCPACNCETTVEKMPLTGGENTAETINGLAS